MNSLKRYPAVFLAVFLAVFCLLGGAAVLAQREIPGGPQAPEKPVVVPESEKEIVRKNQREGTTFQGRRMTVRKTGNRTTLYCDNSNERYICLENLNLERILRAMEENPTRSVWKIDGTYTEFYGENYILIRRAVVSPTDFQPQNDSPRSGVRLPDTPGKP